MLTKYRDTATSTGRDAPCLASLLQLVSEGDERAFSLFYVHTRVKVTHTCMAICANQSASDDVAADVYRTIWLKAYLYEAARSSPVTWICAIARNRSIDWLRRSRQLDLIDIDAASSIMDITAETHESFARRADYAVAISALAKLSEPKRRAITYAFLDEMPYHHIANRMGAPLGTVKSWIRRGLLDLRHDFDAHEGSDFAG